MRLIALALLLAPAAALAQPTADTAASGAAASSKDEKLVCRRDAPVGSRVPGKRVCTTAAQREAAARDAQRDTNRQQQMNQIPQ